MRVCNVYPGANPRVLDVCRAQGVPITVQLTGFRPLCAAHAVGIHPVQSYRRVHRQKLSVVLKKEIPSVLTEAFQSQRGTQGVHNEKF